MTKYKQQFQDMVEGHADLFAEFRQSYDQFKQNPKVYGDEFNRVGEKVKQIVQRYDNLLCLKSESGKYGKFSQNLSEKFWEEVRKTYPYIDELKPVQHVYKKI